MFLFSCWLLSAFVLLRVVFKNTGFYRASTGVHKSTDQRVISSLFSGKLVNLWNWLWWGLGRDYFSWAHWIKRLNIKRLAPCKVSTACLEVAVSLSPVGVTVCGNLQCNLFAVYVKWSRIVKFLPKLSRENTSKFTTEKSLLSRD